MHSAHRAYSFRTILKTAITLLNSTNQLILVNMKCGVLFEVRTEFLNIQRRIGFRELIILQAILYSRDFRNYLPAEPFFRQKYFPETHPFLRISNIYKRESQ
jgi:hypothetical protein